MKLRQSLLASRYGTSVLFPIFLFGKKEHRPRLMDERTEQKCDQDCRAETECHVDNATTFQQVGTHAPSNGDRRMLPRTFRNTHRTLYEEKTWKKKPLSFLFFNVVKYLCMYIGSSMMSAFHFWQAWTADEVTAHAWCGAPRNKPRF